MSPVQPWFERRFEFSVPPQLVPNLLARLRGAPARLEEALRGHPRETLVSKLDSKWSAQEHAGHLLDLEPLWLARVADFAGTAMQLTPADLTNRATAEANHNAQPAERILADFRATRSKLLETVAHLDPSCFGRTLAHPRLQTPMSLRDHLYFVAEHDDHHLARIWELTEIPT